MVGRTELGYQYLDEDECVVGGVYCIHARNFFIGVYDGKGGFIGVREKFGDEFLFTEYHYDRSGTVMPFIYLGSIPSGYMPPDPGDERLYGFIEIMDGWWRSYWFEWMDNSF